METEKIKIDFGHNQVEASTIETITIEEQAKNALQDIQNKIHTLLKKAEGNPYTDERTFPATLSDGLAIIETFNYITETAKKSIELLNSKK